MVDFLSYDKSFFFLGAIHERETKTYEKSEIFSALKLPKNHWKMEKVGWS